MKIFCRSCNETHFLSFSLVEGIWIAIVLPLRSDSRIKSLNRYIKPIAAKGSNIIRYCWGITPCLTDAIFTHLYLLTTTSLRGVMTRRNRYTRKRIASSTLRNSITRFVSTIQGYGKLPTGQYNYCSPVEGISWVKSRDDSGSAHH